MYFSFYNYFILVACRAFGSERKWLGHVPNRKKGSNKLQPQLGVTETARPSNFWQVPIATGDEAITLFVTRITGSRIMCKTITTIRGGKSPRRSRSMGAEISNSFSFVGERNAFLTALIHFPFFPISLQESTVQARSLKYIPCTKSNFEVILKEWTRRARRAQICYKHCEYQCEASSKSRLGRLVDMRKRNETSTWASIG